MIDSSNRDRGDGWTSVDHAVDASLRPSTRHLAAWSLSGVAFAVVFAASEFTSATRNSPVTSDDVLAVTIFVLIACASYRELRRMGLVPVVGGTFLVLDGRSFRVCRDPRVVAVDFLRGALLLEIPGLGRILSDARRWRIEPTLVSLGVVPPSFVEVEPIAVGSVVRPTRLAIVEPLAYVTFGPLVLVWYAETSGAAWDASFLGLLVVVTVLAGRAAWQLLTSTVVLAVRRGSALVLTSSGFEIASAPFAVGVDHRADLVLLRLADGRTVPARLSRWRCANLRRVGSTESAATEGAIDSWNVGGG